MDYSTSIVRSTSTIYHVVLWAWWGCYDHDVGAMVRQSRGRSTPSLTSSPSEIYCQSKIGIDMMGFEFTRLINLAFKRAGL